MTTEPDSQPTPGISVIIPAYNQPRMLGEALRSVRDQTVPPAEIIVIDDCSTDPLELTTSFSPDLPLRFIRQRQNLGPARTVVHGISEARYELIAMLNHDDMWEPEFLQRLADVLRSDPEACLAFCDHGIMDADGQHDGHRSSEQSIRYTRVHLAAGRLVGPSLYRSALVDKVIASSSFALVRRDALDLTLIGAGADMWDYFLTVGVCRTGLPAVYVAERLGWYRVSPTMLSATHADPRKRIEMARPQIAIFTNILLSHQFRSVHGAMCKRLGFVIRHTLTAALHTRSVSSMLRALSRIVAGIRDAGRLSRRSTINST